MYFTALVPENIHYYNIMKIYLNFHIHNMVDILHSLDVLGVAPSSARGGTDCNDNRC